VSDNAVHDADDKYSSSMNIIVITSEPAADLVGTSVDDAGDDECVPDLTKNAD
jgi:hypothetical protein